MDKNTVLYIIVPLDEFNKLWDKTPLKERSIPDGCDIYMAGYKCFESKRLNAIIGASKWDEENRSSMLECLVRAKSKAFISFQETVS